MLSAPPLIDLDMVKAGTAEGAVVVDARAPPDTKIKSNISSELDIQQPATHREPYIPVFGMGFDVLRTKCDDPPLMFPGPLVIDEVVNRRSRLPLTDWSPGVLELLL